MDRNYKRKKRSCGCCKQCLVKHDCGKCLYCINKKTWKQKCILRRCSQMKGAAVNSSIESSPKKWLMTMQLSYKIIEACYNLHDGDQHEILDTVFDGIFISREEDKIAIELEDSASIILTKTRPQTHSFVDIGYSTDFWIRNRKTVNLKPSKSVDNLIKSIKLEKVENITFKDEDASFMSPVDYHEESETECEDNAADNTEQVSFDDNQTLLMEIVSVDDHDRDNDNMNQEVSLKGNNDDDSNHESIDPNQTKLLSLSVTESDQVCMDWKQDNLLQEDEVENSQDGVVTKKEKPSKRNVLGYDQDSAAIRRSLKQERTPRRVSKGVSYCEDDILTEKSEETDDNVIDDDNDDDNYVPTGEESAEEYNCPRKHRNSNIHPIKCEKSPGANYVKLIEHKVTCAKINKEIDDNFDVESNDETFVPDEEENTVESKRKHRMLNICMIKAECPICQTWYKYSRTGIVRHIKSSHSDIPNQFEEQFKEEMLHHKPSEDERVKCDICQIEVDQSFAPLHIQYEHFERKSAQSQIAMAKYYNLRCKSSQPLATKTAKYNFNLSFEKLTNKIEISVCKFCNLQFTLKKLQRHHRKCKKNPDYKNDDDDSYYETDGEENAEECKQKGGKTNKESSERVNMLNVCMIKAECPICQTWYKYSRTGILRHLKTIHSDIPSQFEEQFREEMCHHKPTEDERVKCDICYIEVDQSFAPLHIQYEHFEYKSAESQIALAKYYNLRCKSSQPLATKTAKYNFNLSFEKLTNKIEIAVCKFCNLQFILKQLHRHHRKCKKNPDYKNNDDDSYDETDGEENAEECKQKGGKTHKELGDKVNMLNVYMIKAECPICRTWYKYARLGILRHLKTSHLDIPNQFEEQFREEMRHHKPSEDERVKCDICQMELDQSFAPVHTQYEHSEYKYAQSQIELDKYYKLRSKSSQPFATKTAKYNFNLLFEKLTNKIQTAVCKYCNIQFTLPQLKKHRRKCKKNPDYKKQRYCECGYISIDYEKLSRHKAMCTKKRSQSDDDVDDDSNKSYKHEGDESEIEYQSKFVKSDVHEESGHLATMAEGKQVKSEPLNVNAKIKVVKGKRDDMLNVYTVKTKCPICHSWYKYGRAGIFRHLKVCHLEVPNREELLTQFKEEIRHHKATENEKVICDICNLELDQSFAPLHIQIEHSEYKISQSQKALAKYYKLRCKSSQPLATKTAKYKFSLLFKKLTRNIETAVCEFCGEKIPIKRMEKHHLKCKKNPERRRYYYCVCGFKSVDLTIVKDHKTTCNFKPQNILCDYCGITCKSRPNYFKHRKFFHGIQTKRTTAVKDYPCDQCDKVYHVPSELQTHYNATHSEVKQYICEICARAYSYRTGLKRHIEFAHHNIYRYYCEKCGHGMNKKSLLKTHVCGRTRKRKKLHEIYWAHLEEENDASKPKPKPNKYNKFKKLPTKQGKKPAAASTSRQEPSGSCEPYSMNIDEQSDPSGFVETPNQSGVLYHNHQDQKEILFDNQRKEPLFHNNQDSFTQRSLVMGTAGVPHENMYLPMQNPYINMVEPNNYSSFNMNQ